MGLAAGGVCAGQWLTGPYNKMSKKEFKKPEGSLVAWVCSDVSERALVCERAEGQSGRSHVSVPAQSPGYQLRRGSSSEPLCVRGS